MSCEETTRKMLQEAGSGIPAGRPPLEVLLRSGKRAQQHRTVLQVIGCVAGVALVVGGGLLLQPNGLGTPEVSNSSTGPAATKTSSTPPTEGTSEVKVYMLTIDHDHPCQDAPRRGLAWMRVVTEDTGDTGVDAVRALLNTRPSGQELVNGLNYAYDESTPVAQVREVIQGEGVITIDLDRPVWNPYPNIALCAGPSGESAMQQLVWTVQSALKANDPVVLTVNGKPAEGIWFTRLRGPIQADPAAVAPQTAS